MKILYTIFIRDRYFSKRRNNLILIFLVCRARLCVRAASRSARSLGPVRKVDNRFATLNQLSVSHLRKMSCCRTLLVVLSLFLSVFFFFYGLLLFVRSKNDQVTSRQSNESSDQADAHHNESVIHVSAYMPDARALKYVNARNLSYTFKVSTDFLRRKLDEMI